MEFLSQRGIPFVAKDVSTDLEARAELIALGSRSTPTITVVADVLVGFTPAKLRALLGRCRPRRSHPQHAVARRRYRRPQHEREGEPEHVARVDRIDDAVVPQARAPVVGARLLFVLGED